LGSDADFDGPDWGLGFSPGFFFGTDAAIFFVCFLKPVTSSELIGSSLESQAVRVDQLPSGEALRG
jgi:hypothetical protein